MFSIITVTLDNYEGLRRTHQSLTAQTCRNFEWIVMDGGSADDTLEFLERHPPAHLVSEPDQGLYDAMNKGIALARREYVLFLNAGDCFAAADTLDAIFQSIRNAPKEYVFLYGDALEWERDGTLKPKPARPQKAMLRGMFTHHQAMLYRREKLQHFCFDLRYKIAADYDLTLRFLQGVSEPEILYLPNPVCIFEAGGLSQQKAAQGRKEQFDIRARLRLCSRFMNAIIYTAQTASLMLRRVWPALYWRLRRRSSCP